MLCGKRGLQKECHQRGVTICQPCGRFPLRNADFVAGTGAGFRETVCAGEAEIPLVRR